MWWSWKTSQKTTAPHSAWNSSLCPPSLPFKSPRFRSLFLAQENAHFSTNHSKLFSSWSFVSSSVGSTTQSLLIKVTFKALKLDHFLHPEHQFMTSMKIRTLSLPTCSFQTDYSLTQSVFTKFSLPSIIGAILSFSILISTDVHFHIVWWVFTIFSPPYQSTA